MTGKLRSLFLRIDQLHWLWLGLAAPFLLFPTADRLPALLVIPAIWLLHWVIGDQPRFQNKVGEKRAYGTWPLTATPLNGALALLLFMVLVSIAVTFDLRLSFPKISGMVLGFGLYALWQLAGGGEAVSL